MIFIHHRQIHTFAFSEFVMKHICLDLCVSVYNVLTCLQDQLQFLEQ